MSKITVVIEHGKVQAVEQVPTDVSIEVRNYDVRNTDQKFLSKDENGRACEIREWHAAE